MRHVLLYMLIFFLFTSCQREEELQATVEGVFVPSLVGSK